MFVDREALITPPSSNETSDSNHPSTSATYYSSYIEDGESRVTRNVKEKVLAGLRAQPRTDHDGSPTCRLSGLIGSDNRQLSIPLRGKSISSRCKSTTSMDSGYYSEPRIHTPKVSADSHLMIRKEKSKPPLARAVLEFVVADHPDDFKDAILAKRLRNAAKQAYNKQVSQNHTAKNILEPQTRSNVEDNQVSHSLALPELEHLISGWEAKVNRDPRMGSANGPATRSDNESPLLISLDRQVPARTPQQELIEHETKYAHDLGSQLPEEGRDGIKSCSPEHPNTQSKIVNTAPSDKAHSTSTEVNSGYSETIGDVANGIDHNVHSEIESCVASLVDEDEYSKDNSIGGTPLHLRELLQDPGSCHAFETTLEFVSSSVKDSLLQPLLDYALSEAIDASENSSLSSRSSSARSGATGPTSQSSNSSVDVRNVKRNRGAGGSDPGDDDTSDEEDNDDSRPKKKHAFDSIPQRRLKCPFYQREPDKYTKAACRGEGFTEMGKLKDHLKRVHAQPLRCPRCFVDVDSAEERDEHLSQDVVCAKRPKPHDERIQPQVLRRLDFKKVPFANTRDMGEKWRMMYRILFPGESEADIPSPYDRNTLSPSMAIALSEALEEELTMELAPMLAPIMAHIKERIPAIIHRCRIKLAKHATTTNETSSAPCGIRSETGNRTLGEPIRLRKKKKISHLAERGAAGHELVPRSQETNHNHSAEQTLNISQYAAALPGEGSADASIFPRPPSNDGHAFDMESYHNVEYPEAGPPIGATEDWSDFGPELLGFQSECDGMLLDHAGGFETRTNGFHVQGPAIQSFHNESNAYEGVNVLHSNTWSSCIEMPDESGRGRRMIGKGPGPTDMAYQGQFYRS